jgi:hypothetical protein
VLAFGPLMYVKPDDAISDAKFFSRSHDAVIHVYDDAGNVIETLEHAGEFKECSPSALLASEHVLCVEGAKGRFNSGANANDSFFYTRAKQRDPKPTADRQCRTPHCRWTARVGGAVAFHFRQRCPSWVGHIESIFKQHVGLSRHWRSSGNYPYVLNFVV